MENITPTSIVASYHVNNLISLMENCTDDAFDYIESKLEELPEEILSYVVLGVGSAIRTRWPAKYILFIVFMFGPDEEAIEIVDLAIKEVEKDGSRSQG